MSKVYKNASLIALYVFAVIMLSPEKSHAAEVGIEILREGSSEQKSQSGQRLTVHYEGRLEDGTKFDASYDRNQPFEFNLGAGQVIEGWDIGMEGMRIGEKRRLIIPSELGYGTRGAGNVIPPNATLIFEVELLNISEPVILKNLSSMDLKKTRDEETVIIDIRRQEEWKETGIIEGANLITALTKKGELHPDFLPLLEQVAPNKDQKIILYCRTGSRTQMIGNAMIDQLGYKDVSHLQKGIVGWKKDKEAVKAYP